MSNIIRGQESLQQLSDGEVNCLAIYQTVREAKSNFLTLGLLLKENRDKAYWSSVAKCESFRDFCEMLGIGSYSWITRLIDIAEIVSAQLLTQTEIEEIGVTKAALLLPLVKREKLTDDILAVAKSGTTKDLRQMLYTKDETPQYDGFIICPRCAFQINYIKGMEHWAEVK